MNLAIKPRLMIAIAAVVLVGVVALIFRAVGKGDSEVPTPASFDVAPDLVDDIPEISSSPTPEPTDQPRSRSGIRRKVPAATAAPQPGPSDLSPLDDLPAAPDPRPVDPGEL